MQLLHEDGWIERSTLYAFRSFDELSHGEDYMDADEDKRYKIDVWARLFKADSREKVKMPTERKPEMEKDK